MSINQESNLETVKQEKVSQETVTTYMYVGLLPFFAAALGPWVVADYEALLTTFFLFYSSLILLFLAGVLWALALLVPLAWPRRHLPLARVFSLWPLLAYCLPEAYGLVLMAAGFLLLLFWEKCFLSAVYPPWYQLLRHKVTFMVVACHMLAFFNTIR